MDLTFLLRDKIYLLSKHYNEEVIDKYEYWKFISHIELVKEMYAPKKDANNIGDIISLS